MYGPTTQGKRQADRLDAAEVVAGVVEVEDLLRQRKKQRPVSRSFTSASGSSRRANVLGQLELAAVLLEVGGLKPAQVVLKLLAGKQALLQAVPVAEADVAAVLQAELEAEAALGPLRQVVGELVALEVDAGDLADLPLVELLVGVLRRMNASVALAFSIWRRWFSSSFSAMVTRSSAAAIWRVELLHLLRGQLSCSFQSSQRR